MNKRMTRGYTLTELLWAVGVFGILGLGGLSLIVYVLAHFIMKAW